MMRICLVLAVLIGTANVARAQGNAEEAKVKKLIVQLLEDKSAKKRTLALYDLEVIGPRRFLGILQAITIALEKDAEPKVRVEAALALGRMAEDAREAVPVLAKVLRGDKEASVREVCARTLLQMMPHAKKALSELGEALGDSDAATRAAAAEAIKALGEDAKSAMPRLLEFVKAGKDKKADAPARMYAVMAIGRIGSESAKVVPVLTLVLEDAGEANVVREAAAESLARYGLEAQSAAKALVGVVSNSQNDAAMRLAAVKALGKTEGESKLIWPALKIALGDTDSNLRLSAVRVGGAYGKENAEAIQFLGKIAKSDDNVECRLAAIQELGILGTAAKGARADLEFVLEHDEREMVRQYAEAALKKILGE